ncbi:hypothetical protein Tco_0801988 [Tanacetum coccineum]|uniref:Uncharacterized protein n=1 Tax=Tanacetum coccineum TaxID=301880 RepID=A0ABQ5A1J9_9ASTR
MLLITVPEVMKPVQSMSSPVTPMRRYGNPASKYESYMLAVHCELPNSIQRNVPKPLGKLGPPDLIVMKYHSETGLSSTVFLNSFEILESVYLEYPLSPYKHPVYPAPEPQQARSL